MVALIAIRCCSEAIALLRPLPLLHVQLRSPRYLLVVDKFPRTTDDLPGLEALEICARSVGPHRGCSSHSCRPCRLRTLSSSIRSPRRSTIVLGFAQPIVAAPAFPPAESYSAQSILGPLSLYRAFAIDTRVTSLIEHIAAGGAELVLILNKALAYATRIWDSVPAKPHRIWRTCIGIILRIRECR